MNSFLTDMHCWLFVEVSKFMLSMAYSLLLKLFLVYIYVHFPLNKINNSETRDAYV